MNRIVLAGLLSIFMSVQPNFAAQEKSKTEEKAETRHDVMPLRVQVVIAEYEGDKKLTSLPYTLLVNAESPNRGPKASIRMGLRVPINMGANQFQYQDVGTNLDAWATKSEDGRFSLHLAVDRSSTYASDANRGAATGGSDIKAAQPVIQGFRTELDLLLRDGQSMQTTAATDPVSGRVTKVDVSINVLK
jgi:hypothetical protein